MFYGEGAFDTHETESLCPECSSTFLVSKEDVYSAVGTITYESDTEDNLITNVCVCPEGVVRHHKSCILNMYFRNKYQSTPECTECHSELRIGIQLRKPDTLRNVRNKLCLSIFLVKDIMVIIISIVLAFYAFGDIYEAAGATTILTFLYQLVKAIFEYAAAAAVLFLWLSDAKMWSIAYKNKTLAIVYDMKYSNFDIVPADSFTTKGINKQWNM